MYSVSHIDVFHAFSQSSCYGIPKIELYAFSFSPFYGILKIMFHVFSASQFF